MNPTLRAEAARVAPMLIAAAGPLRDEAAQAEAILSVLLRHAPAYGLAAKSDGEWAAIWGAYVETLGEMPAQAVEEAFSRWKHNELYPKDPGRHAFYPKDNELYALAGPYWTKLRVASWRVGRALAKIEAEKKVNPEVQKAVGAKFGDLLGELRAHRRDNPLTDPPRPQASPQQVAARLRRQAEHMDIARPAAPDDAGEIL